MLLSLRGRIIMINVVLSAILMYFLFFFPLPIWVKRDIDSLRVKFLWNGAHRGGKGFCLVNWKRVCKRKEFGSLGVINLRDFNTTLLLKWWWKLLEDLSHKWASLVSHNHRPITGWRLDRCINEASSSLFWKGMRAVKVIFSIAIAMKVINWRATKFWEDKWCSSVSMGMLFPQLFSLAQDPTGLVILHWLDSC